MSIFLSHAGKDKERVRALVDALEGEGLTVWWDDQLRAGTPYAAEIDRQLAAAACIVVCWTRNAVDDQRIWVRSEADPTRNTVPVVPVLLDDVPLPRPHDQLQAAAMSGWSGDPYDPRFQRLVTDLKTIVHEAVEAGRRTTGPTGGSRRALLVGVGQYPAASGLPEHPCAERNVDDLARALESAGCDFRVQTLKDPDRRALTLALEGLFTGGAADDLVVFYFSGHVVVQPEGTYLALRDSERRHLKATALSLAAVGEDFIDIAATERILIALDVVFDGGGPEEIAVALKTHLGQRHGKVVVASAVGENLARDDPSPLTGRLLTALTSDDADSNHDTIVTVEELSHALAAGPEPRPQFWSFNARTADMVLRSTSSGAQAEIEMQPAQKAFVTLLAPEFVRGTIIPFFGDGIFGTGSLSNFQLVTALATRTGLSWRKSDTLAAAAEMLQLRREDRGEFLADLREILESQAKERRGAPIAAFELVRALKPPWNVFTTTYDCELERFLDSAGLPYVIVCHVLESTSGDAGKVMVVRSRHHPRAGDPAHAVVLRETTELTLELDPDDCVVYKLLGSPFLHDSELARSRGLDTVVITESDHITFLSRMADQKTTIPNHFAVPLTTSRLLFLGYNLDIWHYRLIGRVFRRVQGPSQLPRARKKPFVVREPISPLEEQFWRHFQVEMVNLELSTLVRALRRPPS